MQFTIAEKREIYRSKYITLLGTKFLDKGGNTQEWEYINKADAVLVLPIKDDGKIVLVKNYRVPVERYVIEPPAGLLDKKGESPEEAAKRELLDETGYQASHWHRLPSWPYRAGTSRNEFHGFIATDLTKVSEASGDDTEDIATLEIFAKDLIDLWLRPPDDTYFLPEIIAMSEAAIALGLLKR